MNRLFKAGAGMVRRVRLLNRCKHSMVTWIIQKKLWMQFKVFCKIASSV